MDSRTIKAVLKELAASPREISEACFDPETGALTRVAFVSSAPMAAHGQERDRSPARAKDPRKTAVASLKLAPPEWQPDVGNG